ncbi:hypothetical protein M9782_17470 [Pectobacterium actinidiae]|uniref:hypothetical protein n=1 Tax=Pectobacterium actinidiae TaxID=1507808 RepID=UPI0023AA9692|nr:hypothetical protein [Pectobacterium actinidiae]WEF10966.1 hypothetical protein M9782_17470 [Pectobacterium actinidiae]
MDDQYTNKRPSEAPEGVVHFAEQLMGMSDDTPMLITVQPACCCHPLSVLPACGVR